MSMWIIEPYDPLIFRDGRPFGMFPGVTARSLPAPFPSTIAGGFRSQAAAQDGVFQFTRQDQDKLQMLKGLAIRGPILVQLGRDNQSIEKWLVPAPADALLLEDKDNTAKQDPGGKQTTNKCTAINVHRLLPLKRLEGAVNDLQWGQPELYLVGTTMFHSGKPAKRVPKYWYYDQLLNWLQSNETDLWQQSVAPGQLGHDGPVYEERVHVAIKAETHTGEDGLLFATSGLEFTASVPEQKQEQAQPSKLVAARQLALAVIVDEEPDKNDPVSQQVQRLKLPFQSGPNTLGGERRLVHWNKSQDKEPPCPPKIKQAIIESGACRLILLTPAYFTKGNIPTWLQQEYHGITPQMQAIVNQRPQVVSGWDIVRRTPKASHRLLPAGSVLFLKLNGDKAARECWIDAIWLHSISDNIDPSEQSNPNQGQRAAITEHPDQYRRDGFGLAVLGTWSGKLYSLNTASPEKEVTA